jgi:simple sugar transport system ATP-binding protein
MITHKFREVMSFADEVTVLRRGASRPGRWSRADARGDGRDDDGRAAARRPRAAPQRRWASRAARGRAGALDDLGAPALRQISLDVAAGEIVGIAAVAGNGQEELVEVLAGPARAAMAHPRARAGVPAAREEITQHKVRCLPEEPLRNACVPNMSVAENLACTTSTGRRSPAGAGLSRAALAARAGS